MCVCVCVTESDVSQLSVENTQFVQQLAQQRECRFDGGGVDNEKERK